VLHGATASRTVPSSEAASSTATTSLPAAATAGGKNDDAAGAAMKKDKKNLLVGVWASLATSRPGFPPTGAGYGSSFGNNDGSVFNALL
jgi:hypothetical protein